MRLKSAVPSIFILIAALFTFSISIIEARKGTLNSRVSGRTIDSATSSMAPKSNDGGSCIRLSPACSLDIKKALQNPALKNRLGSCEVKTVTINVPPIPKSCPRRAKVFTAEPAQGVTTGPLVRTGSSRAVSRQSSSRRLQKRAIGFAAPWKYRHIPYFIWDGREYPVQADCASNPEEHAFETWRKSFFKDLKRQFSEDSINPNPSDKAKRWLQSAINRIHDQTTTENIGIRFYQVKNPFQLMYSGVQVLIVIFAQLGYPGEVKWLQEAGSIPNPDWQSTPAAMILDETQLGKKESNQLVAIMHELFHVLGGMHEHERPDRDDYLKFIPRGRESLQKFRNIDFYKGFDICALGSYDFESISHYSLESLAHRVIRQFRGCNFQEIFKLGDLYKTVGQVPKLSKGDLEFLKLHFANKEERDTRKLKEYSG